MNAKEQRKKEDNLMEKLKDPKENHSREISYLIDMTLSRKNQVYLMTDWHLFRRKEKGKSECYRCKNFKDIMKTLSETMTKDDLLIYLGDLCDGELQDKESLKTALLPIPGRKVLVLGNNDLFGVPFYKSCGFEHVVQSFVWANVLFTHVPTKNDNQMNIHGHIHGFRTYWIPYTNQVDVAALGGREKPVTLHEVIVAQKKYAKTIKEDPSHFNEGYELPTNQFGVFTHQMEFCTIEDPFYE